MNEYKGSRTRLDFSCHELKITPVLNGFLYEFKKPNTIIHRVCFYVFDGFTSVTGDFGNWIFSREFHPNKSGENVSDMYWVEKLEMHSEQVGVEFDRKGTESAIIERIKELNHDGNNQIMIDYYEECLDNVYENELDYDYFAYRNYPNDHEDVIKVKSVKKYLKCVFDAFEIMCKVNKVK